MKLHLRIVVAIGIYGMAFTAFGQSFQTEKLKRAAQVVGINIRQDSLLPKRTIEVKAKDGRMVCIRTSSSLVIEHIGIPLFKEEMRTLMPSPVYDFVEYAVLNYKYKVNPNQLYLSKVLFKKGSWDTLADKQLKECDCFIENQEDKLYIVTWQRDSNDVAVIGIPIDYELLNNDTRRNMERSFVSELSKHQYIPDVQSPKQVVDEGMLSIYGTEGLFVIPGKSYILSELNQNVYYVLSTVQNYSDTIIRGKPQTITLEGVLPVVVHDTEHPAESFANLMMCDDGSVPDVTMTLDFHLSDYHRQSFSIPLSQLKDYCKQMGCSTYFACSGIFNNRIRGMMMACNPAKGYNHLFSLSIPVDQLTNPKPEVQAAVYLYIPPIDKKRLFGNAPEKKSGIKLF